VQSPYLGSDIQGGLPSVHPKLTLIGRHYTKFCPLGLFFLCEFLGTYKYLFLMEITYFVDSEEPHQKVNGQSGKPILAKSGQIVSL